MRSFMFPSSAMLLFLAAELGCVSRAEHASTQRALDDAKATLTSTQASLDAAQRTIAARDAKAKELEQAVAHAEAHVAELAEQRALLERQLADEQLRVDAFETQAQNAERSLAELVKRRAGLRAEVERMTEALAQLGTRQLAAERRVAEYRDMLSRFRKLIDAGTLDVRIARGRMVLTMPVDILFPSGSTKLSSEGSRALVEIGGALAGIAGKKFQIEGHTDTVPIHTERFASNWELAAGRALVVTHALIDAGVAPEQLSAASFAEYEPRASNVEEAGRALNRRIEIVVVPDLAELPGNDELQKLDAQG